MQTELRVQLVLGNSEFKHFSSLRRLPTPLLHIAWEKLAFGNDGENYQFYFRGLKNSHKKKEG